MRWNQKTLRALTKTWKRVMRTCWRLCLPEECRDTWTLDKRCSTSPRTLQQSCIKKISCSFFRPIRNFTALELFCLGVCFFFFHSLISNFSLLCILWISPGPISFPVLGGCSLKKHSEPHRDIRSSGWRSVTQSLPSARQLTNCTWKADLPSAEIYRPRVII